MAKSTKKKDTLDQRVTMLELLVTHLMSQSNIQDLSGHLIDVSDDDELPAEFRKKIGFKYGQQEEKKPKKKTPAKKKKKPKKRKKG